MVQNFLQIQLNTPSNPDQFMRKQTRRRTSSETIARSFGQGQTTASNIVKWENSWMNDRIIPERNEREYYASWMDNEDLEMGVREFARKTGDRNYSLHSFPTDPFV